MTTRPTDPASDSGFVGVVEVVYLGFASLLAVVFLGYLGRLAAAGVEVTNAAQDGARAASIATNPSDAQAAAENAAVRSGLPQRCLGEASVAMTWQPSELGTWQGATVRVTVSCTVSNQSLSGVWSPGSRVVSVTDTQIVDRFQR